MNKTEFIAKMAEKTKESKASAERNLNAALETIVETLAEGEKIQFIGFGTFDIVEKKERKGRNPKTQKELIIPARTSPKLTFSDVVKEAVNK